MHVRTAIFLFLIRGERRGYLRNKRYSLTTYKIEADDTHGYPDINHARQATEVQTTSANDNTKYEFHPGLA